MAIIKSYTDIEQSKKLAEILPTESANMYYGYGKDKPEFLPISDADVKYLSQPCWSLASLFNILPVIIGDVLSENSLRLRMDKGETDFSIWYENIDNTVEEGLDIIETNPVDAYYEMILKLHALNLL